MAVNLKKGEKTAVVDAKGNAANTVTVGLGWDPVGSNGGGFLSSIFGSGTDGGSIDLDASCLVYDEKKSVIETVWFRNLRGFNGAIRHTGDNLTGHGKGDDEKIIVQLDQLPANAASLVFTINSFSGQTFDKVANCYCRLVDDRNNEVVRFSLGEKTSQGYTAQIMCRVYRHNGSWKIEALGIGSHGRQVQSLANEAARYI